MKKKKKQASPASPDSVKLPPFETNELRTQISEFFKTLYPNATGSAQAVGSFIWGVYAFYDYDAEPIYVGQTKELLSGRVGRHLTNQRTDAVAMSVLDPFEVCEIEVWPLPQFDHIDKEYRKTHKEEYKAALDHLNALEHHIFKSLKEQSRFKAVLNEKDPPSPKVKITVPDSRRGRIVSDRVLEIRRHPDVRIARRALVVSRLAQVISERSVKFGLRRVLVAQAKRLEWLAQRRFEALGGESQVEVGPENEEEEESES